MKGCWLGGVLLLSLLACSSQKGGESATLTGPLVPDTDIASADTPVAAGQLAPGRTFGQTFFCRNNGLTKIEVLLATYTATIPRGTLNIHLRFGPDQTGDIASVTVPASAIKDNSYVALSFPPIRDSAGKTYYFFLESRDVPVGYAFTVWRSKSDIYPSGSFYADGNSQPHDICFRTYCRPR